MVAGIVSASIGAGLSANGGRHRRGRYGTARPVDAEALDVRARDELPRSIRRAVAPEGFQDPPVALAAPARATAAARAFSAGNGYLPGLIVDRLA